jgi:hypothetical protein
MRLYLLLLVVVFVGIGCQENKESKKDATLFTGQYDKEAFQYLETFLHASTGTRKNLSQSLQPTEKDIKTVFADTIDQRKVKAYIKEVFEEDKFTVVLRQEHQQLKVWSASVSDFKNNETHAIIFPSAFLNVVDQFNSELTFHRFKFVAKGNEAGAAYEGLVKINNRWVLFPKIWKAFER